MVDHLRGIDMNGKQQIRWGSGVMGIIAAAVLWFRPAEASRPYLPLVGSPPLRFQTVTTNYFVFDPKMFQPATHLLATASNTVNQVASPTNEVANTPLVPAPDTSVTLTASSRPAEPDYTQNYIPNPFRRYNFNFAAASASDLLAVTPQMITPYLRPEPNATNGLDHPGAVVFVPAEMQFTPPPTTITAESHPGESRATYSSP
jgi:hypothetical protein